jgi:glycosyltransferase involved in cell wall biosynthesis
MRFCVVVPTYNRPQPLRHCLAALARLDYPRDQFEVIVVDDGSREPLTEIAAEFHERLNIRLLRAGHAGPGAARNAGAAQARGEYLVFTDDDCAPFPDWLNALDSRFQKDPDSLVGGPTLNGYPDNLYAAASQLLINYLLNAFFQEGKATTPSAFVTSNNMAVRAAMFRALGGFQPPLSTASAEDREFCYRWQRGAQTVTYAPEVRVVHFQPFTLDGFVRQHYTYGRGAYYIHHREAADAQHSLRVEPLRFYMRLFGYPFAKRAPKRSRLSALLLLSQAANAAGFMRERFSCRGTKNEGC